MSRFNQYCLDRKINECAFLCASNGIELESLAETINFLSIDGRIDEEQIQQQILIDFQEALGGMMGNVGAAAARGVGNLAGGAWNALKSGVSNVKQGFDNVNSPSNQATNSQQNQSNPTNSNGTISGKQLLQQVQNATNSLKQIQASTQGVGSLLQNIMQTVNKLKLSNQQPPIDLATYPS
jgi:hypothetical protein